MQKNTKLYEAYLRSRISTSKCMLEQVILHAHRLDEAVLGSHYKASLFFGPDDVKFLQQFPRKHWIDALNQRYNSEVPGFNSLYNYLSSLQEKRDPAFKERFDDYHQQELEHFNSNPVYSNLQPSVKAHLAHDHARNAAKHYAYNTVKPEDHPAPDKPEIFEFRKGKGVERIKANPYINELVKKLEGNFGQEDGYDLMHPEKVVTKRYNERTGKTTYGSFLKTDGFRLPTKETIRRTIQNYLKFIGQGILKLDSQDLEDSVDLADKDKNRNPEGLRDNMTRDILIKDLEKRYSHLPKSEAKSNAEADFNELLKSGKLSGPKGQAVDSEGIHDLIIPHKEVTITEVDKNGNEITKKVMNPVIGGGHFFRRITQKEADAVDAVLAYEQNPQANPAPTDDQKMIFNGIKDKLRGSHYDIHSELIDPNGKRIAGSGKIRAIHIDSSHEGGLSRQGDAHGLAGGMNPNHDTDAKKFLGRHKESQDTYEKKINTLFKLFKMDKNGNYMLDESGNKIPNPDADKDGSKLKDEIRANINRQLAFGASKKGETAIYKGTLPERMVLRSAKKQLVNLVFKRILERLGVDGMELHDATGRYLRKEQSAAEINDLLQQNIAGRGSRRTRRDAPVDVELSEIEDIQKYAASVTCPPEKDFRRLTSSRCGFAYSLDSLLKRAQAAVAQVVATANSLSGSADMSHKDMASELQSIQEMFEEALAYLHFSFFELIKCTNFLDTSKKIDHSTIQKIAGKLYGKSGNGSDGDFSGFPEPDKAKQFFMQNFAGKPFNNDQFHDFVKDFMHDDVTMADDLQANIKAKEETDAFLATIGEKYMSASPENDEDDLSKSLIGHINEKIKENVEKAAGMMQKIVGNTPDVTVTTAATTPSPSDIVKPAGPAAPVGLGVMQELKQQLDANPLNYEAIAKSVVEKLGKKYPEETPDEIKNQIDNLVKEITAENKKADAIMTTRTYTSVGNLNKKLLSKQKLEQLLNSIKTYFKDNPGFIILKPIIDKLEAEVNARTS
jgi:hypothetical protein